MSELLINKYMRDIATDIFEGEATDLEDWFNNHDDEDEEYLYDMWKECEWHVGRLLVPTDSPAYERLQRFISNNGYLDPFQGVYEAVRAYIEENIHTYL